jgi:hypothetical protein
MMDSDSLLPIFERYFDGPDRQPDAPILPSYALPSLEALPHIAVLVRIYQAAEGDPRQGHPKTWTELSYPSQEETVAITRRVLNGTSPIPEALVIRTKWIFRRLSGKPGSYCFGLPVVQLRRTEWGLDVADGKWDWFNQLAHFVPAEAVRGFLWKRYGLNLAFLEAYKAAPGTGARLISKFSAGNALAYFG